jgi:TRAP-type C4-dicarboxylate transport system permease small subunit
MANAGPGAGQPRKTQPGTTKGAPPESGPPVSPLDRLLGALNGVGTAWIFVLMLIINADVFGRFVFNSPIDGVSEILELSIVGIVFLQLGDATRAGRLTRSDGLFTILLKRAPMIGNALGGFFDLLGALFMGLILYGSWPLFIEAYSKDLYTGTIGVFAAPTWPIKLVIIVGCAVTLLQFVAVARRHLLVRGPKPAGPKPTSLE